MARSSVRRRSIHPQQEFVSVFAAQLKRMAGEFLASDAFKHRGTKGTEREAPLQEFFRAHMPRAYSIEPGEVVDILGTHSPQLDIMFFDGHRNHAFASGSSASIIPAEALLASIEVKSVLNKGEIEKSFAAAKKLRELRPFKDHLARVRSEGEPADDKCRYFHAVLAYETDIGLTNWMSKEYSRAEAAAHKEQTDITAIDRIYVVNRGLIQTAKRRGIVEAGDDGIGLLFLYMHLLNFIERENRRRAPVPYMEYAGRMTKQWVAFP